MLNREELLEYMIGYIEMELVTIIDRITGGKTVALTEVVDDIDDILENIQNTKKEKSNTC